jgi:hypothetical protein
MPYAKKTIITFMDLDGFLPILKRLAEQRAPGAERVTFAPIIRQALREYLERAGAIKTRKRRAGRGEQRSPANDGMTISMEVEHGNRNS